MDSYSTTSIAQLMWTHHKNGTVGKEIVDTLRKEDGFIPKEGWLWDYKSDFETDAVGLAKTVKQIVSFYNTIGGYIIFGVGEEEKDKVFKATKVEMKDFDLEKLKAKLSVYTGVGIDINFISFELDFNGVGHIFGVLHIPKRPQSVNPVRFIRNSPVGDKNKSYFKSDSVYLRSNDKCLKADSPDHWQMLYSPRVTTLIMGIDESDIASKNIEHNLPDKGLICPNFIGREEILSKLWEWLGDPFEYTRILAGDGGKGKTSSAFEFCTQLIKSPPNSIERVLWLSAKEKQFSGMSDGYYELSDSDYYDLESLLKILCTSFAYSDDELNDVSLNVLKNYIKEASKLFPSLIIVDNIDSVVDDEQKRIIDACRQLASDKFRFILTTRKKYSYSSDVCIDVPGMEFGEYVDFADSLVKRYKLNPLNTSEKKKLHQASDGSPLLTESILRLVKLGTPVHEAISEWSGKIGEDARNAVLRREIDNLSLEAKRVLLAAAYFQECSGAELRQATAIEKLKFYDVIEELNSLFLLQSQRIIESEERFSVSNTTGLIVIEHATKLVSNYSQLRAEVKRIRSGKSYQKKTGNMRRIGQAISQANSLLRENEFDKAIQTIESELRRQKSNQDLLLAKARCLVVQDKIKNSDSARELFAKAYANGQRKKLLFDLWYEQEESVKSSTGMVEVSERAIETFGETKEWLYNLVKGMVLRALSRSEGDDNQKINELQKAAETLSKIIKDTTGLAHGLRVQESYHLHDHVWSIGERSFDVGWTTLFDCIFRQMELGDNRTVSYERAVRCLDEMFAERRDSYPASFVSAFNIRSNKLKNRIQFRAEKDKLDRPFNDISVKIDKMEADLESKIEK